MSLSSRKPPEKIDELIRILRDINGNLEKIAHSTAFLQGIFDEMPEKISKPPKK